jgi:hypothetical protein
MRQALPLTIIIVMAAGAVRAAEPDTAKLAEARSLIAEGLALDRAVAEGRVTDRYARALRGDIVDGLDRLKDAPGLEAAARAALAGLARHDDAALAALRDRLVAQERSHGRAD